MRTEERKKELGEVFTPPKLCKEILRQLPRSVWRNSDKTFLEPSCGNGAFLVEIKKRLLKNGHSLENVLSRIYGIDIMQDNIDECRTRLDPDNLYPDIVNKNILCADFFRYHFRFDGSHPYDDETKIRQRQEQINELFD